MTDNQLFALITSQINLMKVAAGIPDIVVLQAFQPTQQGVKTVPAAYIYKISDNRYGYPEWTEVWDEDSETMIHSDSQQYQTTFQFSALATQDPTTPSAFTAADILNRIAYILQSQPTVAAFEAQSVGILRVTDIRNPYFKDDRARNEASPSFDFVLTHKQINLSITPIITTTELNVLSI
jgi:hypothetical protein